MTMTEHDLSPDELHDHCDRCGEPLGAVTIKLVESGETICDDCDEARARQLPPAPRDKR